MMNRKLFVVRALVLALMMVTAITLVSSSASSAGSNFRQTNDRFDDLDSARLIPEGKNLALQRDSDLASTAAVAVPSRPTACVTPVTENIRGKLVEFDQCYERTFTYGGTTYTIFTYYTEVDSATNLGQCTAADGAGRCEHAMSDNDNTSGDNINAVEMAAEVEATLSFYFDRNLDTLAPGITDFSIFIAEDPRGGGIVPPNSIYCDDELVDNADDLWKQILAYHEIQHLVQDKYDDLVGWRGFYGEGIARAIEDRVTTALDADTGHLFIPEVNGILGNNARRASDITTISYPSVLWWTWLMDQYRLGTEVAPVLGWSALREFYLELKTEADQVKALKDFSGSKGSTFAKDFIDYTLAMFAYRFSPSDSRLGFVDSEINGTGGLSGHTVISGGPAFSTSSQAMNPRSSRYWEFNPANQCDFVAFTFDGNGKTYGFSVMTVDSGNLEKRWTSQSTGWARTVRSTDLERVVGVVTGVDDSGTVDIGYGCVAPTVNIKDPTSSAYAMVGLANNPRHFITRLDVEGQDGSGVAGLVAADFQVQVRKAGGGALIDATVVNSTYVQDDYWLLVQAPSDADGAESGAFYDLIVTLGSSSDSESSALLYVERTQDVVVVLDRSGSMGGGSGKIEAARNAGSLLINELSGNDQGGYVAFDEDAYLRVPLDLVTGTHRSDLFSFIAVESVGTWTSIGDGLRTAATEEDNNGIEANLCSFVLLSDGHENEPDYWTDVQAQVVDNGCAIHTIALGPGTNELLMQQIAASVPGGSYDYATASGGVPIRRQSGADNSPQASEEATSGFVGWENNLSRIYDFKAAQIAGRQRLFAANGGSAASACVDFEDLPLGAQYPVGSVFYDSGATIIGKTFYWQDGTPYSGGSATVGNAGVAGGSGNELMLNNINLAFDFGGPVAGLSLLYDWSGGNLNIEINGEFKNFNSMSEIDGLTIGGVQVSVYVISDIMEMLILDGTINSFAIGGQELAIDNVCPLGGDGLSFFVDDASDKLVVAVGWQSDTKGMGHSQLTDPDGNDVSTAFRRIAPSGTNEVWEVPAPQKGFWTVKVVELGQEFFVSATARSLYEMYLFIGTPIASLSQGVQVPLLVTFVGRGEPLLGAEVMATVKAPDGSYHAVELKDDGNHGDGEAADGVYGGFYKVTSLADQVVSDPAQVVENEEPQVVGSYLVNAVGVKGELRREAQGSFAIQQGRDDDKDRIPDLWEEANGLDPKNPEDSGADFDRDKLNNWCEYKLGTDPRNSDTDEGGESDGSETGGLCVATTQDPLDPDDDRVGPLSSIVAFPEATQALPKVKIVIGSPLWGRILYVNLYRQVYSDTGALIQDWQLMTKTMGLELTDEDVQAGQGYAYMAVPVMDLSPQTLAVTQGTTATGRVLVSNIAQASSDPYAPSGSVLINDGAPRTDALTVTLTLAVDDSGSDHTESPDEPVQGSPVDEITMRLNNDPDFTGVAWQPFQAEVTDWNLGAVAPGQVATVYVQFKDAEGNIGDTGFAQVDSILYLPNPIYLPLVIR